MKSARTVTVKDVAKAAGVSQAAVSMALRGSSEISAKRIEQIQAVARKLNYYPQAAGQLLRAKRKNQIGVVISTPDCEAMTQSGFQTPILGVLAAVCYKQQIGYQLEMHHFDSASPSGLPHQIAANMVDGAILIGDVGPQMYEALAKRPDFPWVSINEPTEYAVLMDFSNATEKILRLIAEHGHKRVAYCDGPRRFLEHRLPYEAFVRFSQANGWDRYLKSHWIASFPHIESAKEAVELQKWALKLLKSKDRPTAVFCHGDSQSRTVAHVAAGLGLEIGRDLSVTSWGSANNAMKTWPIMTAVVYDHEQLAHQALDLLKQRMNDPKATLPVNRFINGSIYQGMSLGPCPVAYR
ncbi:MAG: LacI family DNA-binding transcriptional regulator [Phycisphaeraceae bacterium JB051]